MPSLSRHMAHSVSGGTSTSGASGLAGKSTGYQEDLGMFRCCIRVERISIIVDHGNVDILYKHKKESCAKRF